MTVSLVVVSHSAKIAEGAVELAAQMAPDVILRAAGGTDDNRIGTSLDKVMAALEDAISAANGDGAVVVTDLGSAVMTAESAVEFSATPEDVLLADGPLVEGVVAAAVAAQSGKSKEAVKAAVEAAGASWAGEPAGTRESTGTGESIGTEGLSGARQSTAAQSTGAAESAEGVGPGKAAAKADPEEPVQTGEFELINPMGMHARPAAKIAGGLASLDAVVTVNGVDGTSVMELMGLAVGKGGKLRVEARGKEAERAVRYVQGLVEKGFGEI